MLRAIAFDLDDTLYPEKQYVESGFKAVSDWCERRLGIRADHCETALLGFLARGERGDLFDLLVMSEGLDVTHVPEMVDVYREHTPSINLYPGVQELLDRLRNKYRLGVISDGYLSVQRSKLEALGLLDAFDEVILSDELGRDHWKPSTKPFEVLLDALGVDAEAAVYVGENRLKDFFGAKKVGMRTICVQGPVGFHGHHPAPTPDHAADMEIADLSQLETALASIDSGG